MRPWVRRAVGLGIDLLAPCLPAALVSGILWLWWRPDRAVDWDAFGLALAVTVAGLTVWTLVFVGNELFLASARGRTVGERVAGVRLVLPDEPVQRRLRMLARAVLRLGVVLAVLSAVGLSLEHVGERPAGAGTALVASAAIVVAVCRAGARGPVTVIERVCRVGVVVRRVGGAPGDDAAPERDGVVG